MEYLPISQMPMPELDELDAETADVLDEMLRETQSPFVGNIWRALAFSPPLVRVGWEASRAIFLESSLPMSLKVMIMFAVSAANECKYCSAAYQVACTTMGIDEASLQMVVDDVENLNPRRVRDIIEFSMKCARNPHAVGAEEFDNLRHQGITDEEIMEIIALVALGNFTDTFADVLKVQIDTTYEHFLGDKQLVR